MCVYVCVRVCCVCVKTYTSACVCIYIDIYMCVCVYICVNLPINVYVHVYMCMYLNVFYAGVVVLDHFQLPIVLIRIYVCVHGYIK